ncbi:hypothetical protein MKX01_037240 [Papaver californicum]|nr:hypothetical protein MKX01_037240 [Papaver californicum]
MCFSDVAIILLVEDIFIKRQPAISDMLFCDGVNGANPNLSHSTAHFFGVSNGHGGSQVLSILLSNL